MRFLNGSARYSKMLGFNLTHPLKLSCRTVSIFWEPLPHSLISRVENRQVLPGYYLYNGGFSSSDRSDIFRYSNAKIFLTCSSLSRTCKGRSSTFTAAFHPTTSNQQKTVGIYSCKTTHLLEGLRDCKSQRLLLRGQTIAILF